MLRKLLRLPLLPVFFLVRLALGTAAFIISIASAVVGLCASVLAILAVIELSFGYWQNSVALLALSLLVSPMGLPALANWTLEKVANACAFLEELATAKYEY